MSSRAAAPVAPDVRLKKLRRLDANMTCPNCGTKAQTGIGFGNVCVKYKTFVCDLCKTSHQAISHRVKSITMSNWTDDEVNELMDENCGGNAACQHVWLAKAPAYGGRYSGGSRPREGDRVEVFKKFVTDCYELGMFRADVPYAPGNAAPSASSGSCSPVGPTSAPSSAKQSRPAAATAPAPKVADLVSFDSDPFASSGPVSSKSSAFDDFGSFPAAPAAGFDDFGYPTSASSSAKSPLAPGYAAPTPAPAAARASTPAPAIAARGPAPQVKPVAAAQQVDLLSYEPVSPTPAAQSLSQKQKQPDTSLLDLLSLDSALPAPAPMSQAMPMRQTPPAMAMPLPDPFSSAPLLQPAAPPSRSPPMLSGNGSPMMGMGYNGMAPRPPMQQPVIGMGMPMAMNPPMGMSPGMGPSMGMGMNPGMGMAMNPSMGMAMNPGMSMGSGSGRYGGASPMMSNGAAASAISALGTSPLPFRGYSGPSQGQTQTAVDRFSYVQDTMKKHLGTG